MTYSVEFSKEAVRELKKLDKHIALFITAWIRKNLEGCANPRQHGEALVGNLGGQWRYSVGDYRVLAEIQDEKILILVLSVGHRKEVYR